MGAPRRGSEPGGTCPHRWTSTWAGITRLLLGHPPRPPVPDWGGWVRVIAHWGTVPAPQQHGGPLQIADSAG